MSKLKEYFSKDCVLHWTVTVLLVVSITMLGSILDRRYAREYYENEMEPKLDKIIELLGGSPNEA